MVGSTAGRGKSTRKKTRKPQGKPERQKLDRFIPGFHAVRETLGQEKSPLQEIWIAEGKRSARTEEILRLAIVGNIPICFKKKSYLSELFVDISHQGIVGVTKAFAYSDFQQVLHHSLQKGPSALLLAADHITDPGNLGALIRTAAFFGAHGLVLPKDRSAGITAATLKRASGTHHQLHIAQVTNLGRSLDELSKNDFWIIGTAGEAGVSIYDFDWNRPVVLVLGSEQKGISPSIRKRCHQLVGIPSPGGVESLNISVAGGVVLSEICRHRNAFV
ncbi:MAG: 23S rRNA (guanosine(2251)-2'-O)-methyltransferase RlmB [Desulfobacteraceae bacterium 4572_87]|nr:MAG: 23S rRNA (guanosine(2251)-2'-O)-methyltransferase RlmB [Desulfobacteraceae bacterium 4572_87]